ncbi:hypothetical protein VNO77_02802 [Canavalia gladiata]|uniref:Uncharacterized protein n=1 Tax=Canavalia gladiata TaxID=3824 RepID=A0AAN9N042_CANGL
MSIGPISKARARKLQKEVEVLLNLQEELLQDPTFPMDLCVFVNKSNGFNGCKTANLFWVGIIDFDG